jgi:hypothetical protein
MTDTSTFFLQLFSALVDSTHKMKLELSLIAIAAGIAALFAGLILTN